MAPAAALEAVESAPGVPERRGVGRAHLAVLAHLAGVHRTYAGGVERVEYNVSLTNIHEFAKALGVDVRDLF